MLQPAEGSLELPFGVVPHGQRIELDTGVRAFVRSTAPVPGATPTMLLHGLGATGALNWAPLFGPLGRTSQVVAIDHRGHGRGPRVGNRFRLADCADDAAAVIRAIDAGPALVVGYSMGGPIAQLLALRHPDLVAGMVLCATARDFRGHPADRLRFAAVAAAATAMRVGPRSIAPLAPVLPGSLRPMGWAFSELRRHEPAGVTSAARALGRFSSREWISELDVPTAVLVHERDGLVPPRRQEKLAASIPGAMVVRLDLDHLGISGPDHTYARALLAARRHVLRGGRTAERRAAVATA
jgi:3-oxoadipate enol-lactonase